MTPKTRFRCAECSTPAQVLQDGKIVRRCDHETAPVVAEVAATVYGLGGTAKG